MAAMIPANPRILFIANAGPEVGGGHVMRCLTLAEAMGARGASCAFAASPDVAVILEAFAPHMAREAAAALNPDALVDSVTAAKFDAVVFDHYGLGRREHISLADGKLSLVVDDLADRALGGDLVLDSGLDRNPLDYTLLVDGKTRLLLGPDYAPVRSQFGELRPQALARRGGGVGRILLSLGLGEQGELTERLVDLIRSRLGQASLDVVLGGQSPSVRALNRIASRDTRLTIHVDTPHMAQVMAGSDLMITAAGSTIWEGCTLGRPMIALILAENQRGVAQGLASRSAAMVIDPSTHDFEATLDRTLVRLMSDGEARGRLADAASEICTGQGAALVADAMFAVIAARS